MYSPDHSNRVDVHGRAFAGSQKWIQYFVNWRTKALDESILTALPSLRAFDGALQWVSPMEGDNFAEYRDEDFLAKLGLTDQLPQLRSFWPRGGPCWDALASVRGGLERGVVLVEAKSYPGEMQSNGCKAGAPSRGQIERALNTTKQSLGAMPSSDWLGPLYQCANRLAHLYFFREVVRVPAWLVNICFINDPRSPTTEVEWRRALDAASNELGVTRLESEFSAVVFLEAQEGNF